MARAKRSIMLLNLSVPAERELSELLAAVPDGGEAGFVRGLVMLGFKEARRAAATDSSEEGKGDGQ